MIYIDSIWDARRGAGYITQDLDDMLLIAAGSCLFEPSILEAKLIVIWTYIIYIMQKLLVERIFIKGNFATIIAWIHDKTK